ncbi:MAG: sensor histidine kinase [Gammaproteobacteria bacterium]
MKLADFIERDMESILSQWEAFARSLPAGKTMDVEGLRDHAEQILKAVRKHIATLQTLDEQHSKSRGLAVPLDAKETAAQTHALLRARWGFDINEMASEYRALRASVLRLWADACAPEPPDLSELIRFNEAIDQALCESIGHFSAEVDRARDLLLGILGHDLRNPLTSIQLTARHLQLLNAGDDVTEAAGVLIRSGASMKALLDDLTDFNRTRLGLGIRIRPTESDLGLLLEDQLQQIRASNPTREISLTSEGDLDGKWDEGRMHQIFDNLVSNALRYGAKDGRVVVKLHGSEREIVFTVENEGDKISAPTLARMFEPLVRGEEQLASDGNMGLGLYICREIARAHGGSIAADSTDTGTAFTVRLPVGADALTAGADR